MIPVYSVRDVPGPYRLTITPPPPMFFVSVDSGGFRVVVSCLESTLVGWFVSVAFKWVSAGMI